MNHPENDDLVSCNAVNEAVFPNQNLSTFRLAQLGNNAPSFGKLLEGMAGSFGLFEKTMGGSWRFLDQVLQVRAEIFARGIRPDYSFSHSAISRMTSSCGTT